MTKHKTGPRETVACGAARATEGGESAAAQARAGAATAGAAGSGSTSSTHSTPTKGAPRCQTCSEALAAPRYHYMFGA